MNAIDQTISEIAGDFEDKVEIGRLGYATKDICKIEIQRFAGNRPSISKIVGVEYNHQRDEIEFENLKMRESGRSLTTGKNGDCWYDIKDDGVYECSSVLFKSSRISKVIFYRCDSGVVILNKDEALQVMSLMYPDKMQKAEASSKVMKAAKKHMGELRAEILKERGEFENTIIDSITAIPEFRDINDFDLRDLIYSGCSDDEILSTLAVPSHYVVTKPVFAKASTAEQAVEEAKKKIEERNAIEAKRVEAAEKARKEAEEAGLPALTGTPRQIRWAEQIRANAAKKNPALPQLKRWKKASRWIEARACF
jgi:hypothetical protein